MKIKPPLVLEDQGWLIFHLILGFEVGSTFFDLFLCRKRIVIKVDHIIPQRIDHNVFLDLFYMIQPLTTFPSLCIDWTIASITFMSLIE